MSNLIKYKKVALVGASSTGKSTVFELLKFRLSEYTLTDDQLQSYQFVNESTRTVKTYGFPINEEGTDVTQLAISTFHLHGLITPKPVIYDRCYMDLLAYSRHLPLSDYVLEFIESMWYKVRESYDLYIYFPIEFHSVDDGIRSVDEEWRHKVDKEFQDLLTGVKIGLISNVLTVQGSPKARVQQILEYLTDTTSL